MKKDKEIDTSSFNPPEFSMNEIFNNLPAEYFYIDQPKKMIAMAIYNKMKEDGLTIREVANKIEKFKHPQLVRITRRDNYNIETLLKVLNALDLELVVQKRQKKQ